MDKERALDIIKAHACCSFATIENKLCDVCPWKDSKDCVEATRIDEKLVIKLGECVVNIT